MEMIGDYWVKNGGVYVCHFNAEEKSAVAIGPTSGIRSVGSSDLVPVVSVENVKTIAEARRKLGKKLGRGEWKIPKADVE